MSGYTGGCGWVQFVAEDAFTNCMCENFDEM